jgi:hypothetical protein
MGRLQKDAGQPWVRREVARTLIRERTGKRHPRNTAYPAWAVEEARRRVG